MTPEELVRHRARLGVTQRELAKTLGVARSTVVRWEVGGGPIPGWLPLAIKALSATSMASARLAAVSGDHAYVYIRSEPRLWTVGFYHPDGRWEPESDWVNPEDAAARTAYLNGAIDADEYDRAAYALGRAAQPVGSS
jgi:DNA-binding XRE family transcriptional regulator